MALQALGEYSAKTSDPNIDLDVTVQKGQQKHSFHISNENADMQLLTSPVEYSWLFFLLTTYISITVCCQSMIDSGQAC